jgi:hypothetical protein
MSKTIDIETKTTTELLSELAYILEVNLWQHDWPDPEDESLVLDLKVMRHIVAELEKRDKEDII